MRILGIWLIFLGDYFAYFKAKLGQPRSAALKINSIGLRKEPKKGEWEMGHFIYCIPFAAVSSTLDLR